MRKFKAFGLGYEIELDHDQKIVIEEIDFFPQYNGNTVSDVYNIIEMDPWDESIFDIYENEIYGDELDLISSDLTGMSYKGKQDILKQIESGETDQEDASLGYAFDIIWEMNTEDEDFQKGYLDFLKSIKDLCKSSQSKEIVEEILENAKDPFHDNVVVIVYKISRK
jgi:hypothetical protein